MGAKPKCPKCESGNVVPIEYGLPAPEGVEKARRGEIVLGGCCVTGDDPKWFCTDCDYAFRKAGDQKGDYWKGE